MLGSVGRSDRQQLTGLPTLPGAACCARTLPRPLQPKEVGLPFTAYTAIDKVREVRTPRALRRPGSTHSCASPAPHLAMAGRRP
jgi:hypothetical protein